MDVTKTTVTVYPEEGNFPEIAKALLDAADHPGQVRTVSHPQSGFEVPEDVFQRFEAAQQGQAEKQEPQQQQPARRRPGRPRKSAQPAQPQAGPESPDAPNANKEE